MLLLVAPQPIQSQQLIVVTAGGDVILTCIIEMAYPPPLLQWAHVAPHRDIVPGKSQQLNNGSLLLTGVKTPAIYKCIAWNEFGASVQLKYISKCTIEVLTYVS